MVSPTLIESKLGWKEKLLIDTRWTCGCIGVGFGVGVGVGVGFGGGAEAVVVGFVCSGEVDGSTAGAIDGCTEGARVGAAGV